MVITIDKTEMTTGNNLLHGEGKAFQTYLTKFAMSRVRTARGEERRKRNKSGGIYQQCDITSDNDIPRIEEQRDCQILRLSSRLHHEENCRTDLISTVTSPVGSIPAGVTGIFH